MKGVAVRNPSEIARLRLASRIVGEILSALEPIMVPGISTGKISLFCEKHLRRLNAQSASSLLGFPGTVCTSVNAVAVHGIPGDRILQGGDIVTVDLSLEIGGWFGDGAVTFGIGKVSPEVGRLLRVAKKATIAGITATRPGVDSLEIGRAVERYVDAMGMSVIADCLGHGIGRSLHEPPVIPFCSYKGKGFRLEEGMVFTIEPVVTLAASGLVEAGDGWSKLTSTGLPAAQWEHTVLVTRSGCEVLTVG